MRNRYSRIYGLPAVLAFVGPVFLVLVTGGGFLPLAIGWWIASLTLACIKSRRTRMGLAVALLPICVLTTFEGGLFMLPAVVALLAIDLTRDRQIPLLSI